MPMLNLTFLSNLQFFGTALFRIRQAAEHDVAFVQAQTTMVHQASPCNLSRCARIQGPEVGPTFVSRRGPINISYNLKESAPKLNTMSSGFTTLPRLLLILKALDVT